MDCQVIEGYYVYKFKCIKCGWTTQLTITDLIQDIICPRWKCEVRYLHANGDLTPEDRWEEKSAERAQHFAEK